MLMGKLEKGLNVIIKTNVVSDGRRNSNWGETPQRELG